MDKDQLNMQIRKFLKVEMLHTSDFERSCEK